MILGHQKQIQYLKKILESKKIPHAILFSGEKGLGKKRVALEFIFWIFKEPPLSHPDFIFIEPKNHQIQIDQIRELSWRISLKPIKSEIKVALIDSAHSMTKEAQNCFLKTLEEPKGNALIILISEHPKLLLPTILSRCQEIKFFLVEKEEIENYLKKRNLEKEKIEKILDLANGKPEIAISLAENNEKFKEIEELRENLGKIDKNDIFLRFNLAKEILEKFEFLEILRFWTIFLRKKFLSSFDQKSFQILKEIQKIYFFNLISPNLDQRLALENLFLKA